MISIRTFLGEPIFNIGFIRYNNTDVLEERTPTVNWLNLGCYTDGWFADPFILQINDSDIVLLAEEYEYKKKKGRISQLVVDKQSLKLKNVNPVLELDTHLSFPYIFPYKEQVYVCPENYASGSVKLYRRNEAGQLVEPIIIIPSPLVDTQLLEYNGFFYAFGVETRTGKNEESKTLKVYRSESLFVPFSFFCEISNIFAEERGAGVIFNDNQRIIRPAQSCERGYGDSMVFYSLHISDSSIKETIIGKIYPKMSGHYNLGLHTFNKQDDICVVDGKDYRRYPLARIIKVFK